MKLVLALSGLDGSGKTTQTSRLRKENVLVDTLGPLSAYQAWPKLEGEDLFRWWFLEGSTDQVIGAIQACLVERQHKVTASGMPVILVDRGDRMFEAVCAATISVRDKCGLAEAKERLKFLKPGNAAQEIVFHFPKGDSQALLQSRRPSDYSTKANAVYYQYQSLLTALIAEQIDNREYALCVDATDPIENIQRQCQLYIEKELLRQIDTQRIDRVFALGGMSESGKSFVGQYLFRDHGVQRLKISYFLENVGKRFGLPNKQLPNGVYDIGNSLLALLFLEELAAFARHHYYQGNYSIESLHNFSFTEKLKTLLGDRLKIIYAEAPESLRVTRLALEQKISQDDALAAVRSKDSVKASRGAEQIRKISDLIIDNSSSRRHTQQQLDGVFIEPRQALPTKKLEEFKLPEPYRATLISAAEGLTARFGSALSLLVVTGSGGREDIIEKWSDLDLLLVIEAPTEKAIEGVADSVRGFPIKVGTTTYTRREFEDGLIDSKTVYHNELLRSRVIVPSVIDPSLKFPAVSEAYRRKLHQMLLPNMLQNLRRHLQMGNSLNVHDTAKEVDTIMKYLVGRKGTLSVGYVSTMSRFYELHPSCPKVRSVPELMSGANKVEYQLECCRLLDFIIEEVT